MDRQGEAHHLVTPRVLLFLQRDGRWLFLEGAEHKWWAGRWNGLGGSVEPGETILEAARRETLEETGLAPADLELVAIAPVRAEPEVLLFVLVGRLPTGELRPTDEGTYRWLTRSKIDTGEHPLMPDLTEILPRVLARRPGTPPLHLAIDHRGATIVREDDA